MYMSTLQCKNTINSFELPVAGDSRTLVVGDINSNFKASLSLRFKGAFFIPSSLSVWAAPVKPVKLGELTIYNSHVTNLISIPFYCILRFIGLKIWMSSPSIGNFSREGLAMP